MEPEFDLANTEEARRKAHRLFAKVKLCLEQAIPYGEIIHVGSTAVPGCLTKGDLDVVIRVPVAGFSEADLFLQTRYIRNKGSARTGAFSAFEDPSSIPHLGIQLVAVGGPFDFFHQFADALRSSPDLLNRYNELKRSFVGSEMQAYRAAKSNFIEQALAKHKN